MGVRAGVYWPGRGDNHPGSAATPGRIGQARRSYRNKELRTKPVRRFAESRMNVAAPFYARFLLSRFAATKGMERKLRKHVPIDRSKDSGSLLDTCATNVKLLQHAGSALAMGQQLPGTDSGRGTEAEDGVNPFAEFTKEAQSRRLSWCAWEVLAKASRALEPKEICDEIATQQLRHSSGNFSGQVSRSGTAWLICRSLSRLPLVPAEFQCALGFLMAALKWLLLHK